MHEGSRRSRLPWRLAAVVAVLVTWVAFVEMVAQPFVVPSSSMAPTLEPGDRILVSKAPRAAVARGDIVVFRDPGGWLLASPHPTSEAGRVLQRFAAKAGIVAPGDGVLVKRVLGVAGDRVRCCDDSGRIRVNGLPLNESQYIHPLDHPSQVQFDLVVAAGHVWLMGDHRSVSRDSRFHQLEVFGGAVDEDLIIGRAVAVLWPPSRMGPLRAPRALPGRR